MLKNPCKEKIIIRCFGWISGIWWYALFFFFFYFLQYQLSLHHSPPYKCLICCLYKQQMSESCMFRTCTRNFSLFPKGLVESFRKRGGGGVIPTRDSHNPIRNYLDPPPKRRKDNSCLELSNSQIIRSHWHCF